MPSWLPQNGCVLQGEQASNLQLEPVTARHSSCVGGSATSQGSGSLGYFGPLCSDGLLWPTPITTPITTPIPTPIPTPITTPITTWTCQDCGRAMTVHLRLQMLECHNFFAVLKMQWSWYVTHVKQHHLDHQYGWNTLWFVITGKKGGLHAVTYFNPVFPRSATRCFKSSRHVTGTHATS